MKKIFTLISLSLSLSPSLLKADYWTQKADFPGTNRDFSFSFSIGAKGYAGCGRDSNLSPVNAFWEYDQLTNAWSQKADFAGGARYSATGFAISGKGYGCLGKDVGGFQKNDVWQYDPATNNWIQKSNFSGSVREQSVSFIIQNKAYISCGHNLSSGYLNELWEYEPVTDTWLQKTSFPGTTRISPIAFTLSDKGYIGAGYFFNGVVNFPVDFWEYDSVTDSWLQKADFAGTGRTQVIAFALFNRGFTGTGDSQTAYLNDFWQYNPVLDQWIQKINVPGPARNEAISFSIGNKGYAGIGEGVLNFPHDFWEYTPDSTTDINEHQVSGFGFQVYPNPVKDFLVISSEFRENKKVEISITDAQGKKAFGKQLQTKTLNFKLQTSNFSKGIYFVEVSDGKEKAVKKFVKE